MRATLETAEGRDGATNAKDASPASSFPPGRKHTTKLPASRDCSAQSPYIECASAPSASQSILSILGLQLSPPLTFRVLTQRRQQEIHQRMSSRGGKLAPEVNR